MSTSTCLSLAVNGRGEALAQLPRRRTVRDRDVLVWGAMNAHAPDTRRPQVRFELRLRGGWRTYGSAGTRGRSGTRCRAVRRSRARPPRRRLQGARRLLLGAAALAAAAPMRGFDPFRPRHVGRRAARLALVGPAARARGLAELDYGGRLQGLFGRLILPRRARARLPDTVRDEEPTAYARYVYIDTFNSVYGRGWRRDTGDRHASAQRGLLLQLRRRRRRRPAIRRREPRGPGNGERHRVTVDGPGRDADRAVGGRGPARATTLPRIAVFNGSSTGSSGRTTRSAHAER